MAWNDSETLRLIFYTKPQQDRATAEALSNMGVEAIAPVEIETGKSRGKSRAPEVKEITILPRVVFATMTRHQYHEAMVIGAARSILAALNVSRRVWSGQVQPFIDAAEGAKADALARIAAGKAIQHFRPGDKLMVLSGALQDRIVEFVESVEADAGHAVRARFEMMGKDGVGEFDPHAVRRIA